MEGKKLGKRNETPLRPTLESSMTHERDDVADMIQFRTTKVGMALRH